MQELRTGQIIMHTKCMRHIKRKIHNNYIRREKYKLHTRLVHSKQNEDEGKHKHNNKRIMKHCGRVSREYIFNFDRQTGFSSAD